MLLIFLIICVNGVNATVISDNSTIGDQSPTIYMDSSYGGYIGSDTQSNQFKLLSSAVGNATGGETLYVSPNGDDNNSGTRDSPLATLSHAIDITETGNIVLLEGIHKVNDLTPDKTLNITGEGNVTIDASNTNRIMYIYSTGDVTLSNVGMINGYSSESAALIGNAGKLTLINTTLSDSVSNNNGGAIYNVGTLTIINSIFKSNTANLGGAIYSGENSKKELNVRIVNTTFADNTASGNSNNKGGGAIYAQASSGVFILENVTFENNKAGKYGGGALYTLQLDNIKISNSKFINNSAQSNEYYGGGAIALIGGNYQREGTTTITNTLFENNKADMSGGAIFVKGTTLDISNSVLVNSGDSNGIVIYNAPTVNSINSKITANDNWWGSNNNPKNLISKVSTVTLNRWAILTIENDTEITQGNDVTISVNLTNYTTGSENGILSKPITIERNVSVQTSFEEINGVLVNGVYNLVYSIPAGLKLISATVDGQSLVLYVVESQAFIELDDVSGKKGSKVNITAQILTSDSQVINEGYINFYVDSKLIGYANVLNNNAFLAYLIKEDEGIYNLTAEYISTSGAFNASKVIKILNVSGLNNIVREDNFYEFFDDEGIIRDEILFDELIFEGEFNNIPQIITIDNPIKITGDNAVLNNIVFMVMADDVELDNITFIENETFINNYGSVILVTSTNVSLTNNKINYNAPKDSESYVVYADGADELKLINNDITFSNELTMKQLFTNAIYLTGSDDVLIKNNTMDITIPSVDIDYDDTFVDTVYSEGVVLEGCDNAVICDNGIHVKYNDIVGNLDSLRAVDIKGCGYVSLTNNTITLDGHKYAYALVISGDDFNLYNNTINSSSDINYANGINVYGPASGTLTSNKVSAIAPNASYPIYSASYAGNVYVEYESNSVYGNAHDVYGIYLSGTDENLTNNNVLVTGNFAIGIASSSANTVISNNTVYSQASNIGQALNLDEIPCNTSGITSIRGNNVIDANIIETTGKYSVNIQKGQVTNNYLFANNTYGDNSVYPKGSSVLIENNIPLMKTANLTVNNVSLNVGDEIAFNVTLTDADNNPLANYTVNLNVNGSEYQATTDINGIATFELDSLPVGIYEMEFIVDSRDIIELIEENALLNITLNSLNVNVTTSDICEGEDLIINITVPDNLDEDLVITINNSTYLIKNSDSIIISNLTVGNYPITVYYPGDGTYAPYNFEDNVTVNPKVVPKENLTLEASAEPITVGENATIVVTGFENATGTVTIGNEVVSIFNGIASAVLTNLPAGNNTVPVTYSGDDKYNPIETEVTVTVNKIDTILTVEDVITVYNTARFVVATLTDVTGTVLSGVKVKIVVGDLTEIAETDENGQVSLDVTALEPGEYAIRARSSGINGIYSESKAFAHATVYPEKLNASLTVPDVYVIGDSSGVVVATLKDDEGKALGGVNVKIVVDKLSVTAKTDENGQVSLDISELVPGEYKISARSSGVNDLYKEAKAYSKAVVSEEKLDATLTVPDVYVIGDSSGVVVATLKDSDGKAISDVNVKIVVDKLSVTAKTDAKGQASLDVSSLAPGQYKVSARSSGVSDIYKEAKATAKAIVSEDKLDVTLSVPDVVVIGDSSGAVVATLKDSYGNLINGVNVKLVIGDLTVNAKTDENGQVSVDVSDLAPGVYKVSARSSGVSDIYKEAKAYAKVIVSEEKLDTTLTVPDVVVDGNSSAVVVATLKDSYNYRVSGVNVKITVGDLTKTARTDENGQVSLDISSLAPGNYKISARSSGVSDIYNESRATAKATVKAN